MSQHLKHRNNYVPEKRKCFSHLTKQDILSELTKAGGSRTKAARAMGMTTTTLYKLVTDLGITLPRSSANNRLIPEDDINLMVQLRLRFNLGFDVIANKFEGYKLTARQVQEIVESYTAKHTSPMEEHVE